MTLSEESGTSRASRSVSQLIDTTGLWAVDCGITSDMSPLVGGAERPVLLLAVPLSADFETLRRGHRLPYRHSRAAGHPAKHRSESVSMRDGPGGDPARA